MMFSLTDGRVMYVPPIVAAKIEAEGMLPGSALSYAKRSLHRTSPRRWKPRRTCR